LRFRNKYILAGDLNTKHLFWNSSVSKLSAKNLSHLFIVNDFEVTAPQLPTHYTPTGNGDVLEIVVHQNIRLSHVTASDIQDSGHLPIVFHILDHVTTKKLSQAIEKFKYWE
jgi:hypothetical protein